MRWNCGPTLEEKRVLREEWHDWFAWYPVRVGSGDCRWLTTVERRGIFISYELVFHWKYEYRPKEK